MSDAPSSHAATTSPSDGLYTQALDRVHTLPRDGRIRTTLPNKPYAALRWVGSLGCSAAPTAGGDRAATMNTLIVAAKMNVVDPQARLADVLARIAAHPAERLDELLPWNWRDQNKQVNQAA